MEDVSGNGILIFQTFFQKHRMFIGNVYDMCVKQKYLRKRSNKQWRIQIHIYTQLD